MRSTSLSESEIRSALHQFDQWGWIELVKPSFTASISWKTARIRAESLTVAKELLENRKRVSQVKWKTMEQYLTPQDCRAATIERYFGEEDAVPCGTVRRLQSLSGLVLAGCRRAHYQRRDFVFLNGFGTTR